MSTRAEPVRTRPRAAEGSTLVLLHPGEIPTPELAAHLVAVLFAAASPLVVIEAARVLDVPVERVEEVCEYLHREPPTGLALQRHGDYLQLTTAPGSAGVIERYLGAPPPVRLSRAALEALAVIAYRQPVTRGEIDAVRGVNSDSAVSTLLTRSLVTEVGRRETVGRPALLAVTPDCLQYLGIHSLGELPPLPEGAHSATDPSLVAEPVAEDTSGVGAERVVADASDPDAQNGNLAEDSFHNGAERVPEEVSDPHAPNGHRVEEMSTSDAQMV